MLAEIVFTIGVKLILTGIAVAVLLVTHLGSNPVVARNFLHNHFRERFSFKIPTETDLANYRIIDLSTAWTTAAFGLSAIWLDRVQLLGLLPVAAALGAAGGHIATGWGRRLRDKSASHSSGGSTGDV